MQDFLKSQQPKIASNLSYKSGLYPQVIQSVPSFSKRKNEFLQNLSFYYTPKPSLLYSPSDLKDEHSEIPIEHEFLNSNSILQPTNKHRFLTSQKQNGITELGHKCLLSEECVNGAECLFNVCACPPKTVANNYGYCVSEELENIINQYSSSLKGELKKIYLRDISNSAQTIKENNIRTLQNLFRFYNNFQNVNADDSFQQPNKKVTTNSKFYTNNYLINNPGIIQEKINIIYPGMPCSSPTNQQNAAKCAYSSVCLDINYFKPNDEFYNFRQSNSFCICDQDLVTNASGYCTPQQHTDTVTCKH